MAKFTIQQHIDHLEDIRDQNVQRGLESETKKDILAYLGEYKVTNAEAKKIMAIVNAAPGANVLRQAIGQGTLFGFGDELEGLGRGLYEGLTTDKPYGEAISSNIDKARADIKNYESIYPYKSTALQVGGGLLTGLAGSGRAAAMRGAALLPRMLQGAKTGAAHGTLSGAGRGEGNVLTPEGLLSRGLSAGTGTLTGAGVGAGAPVVGDILRGAGRFLGGIPIPKVPSQAKRQAGRVMRRALDDDEITVPAIRAALSKMPAKARIPDTADVYSTGMRDLARHAATTSGGKAAHRFLAERHAEQAPRLLEQVDRFLPTQSLNDYLEETTAQRSGDASRQYGEAYAKELEMSDELKYFLSHPKIKQAWGDAKSLAEWEDIDLGEAVERLPGGTTYARPTLQVMDYIKQSLDGQVNRLYSGGDSTEGSKAKLFRNKLRDFLDAAVPEYKEARSIYAGHSAAMEAAAEGRKFILTPRTFDQKMLKDFGDHEMQSFRVGVADALRLQINESGDKADALNKIFNSPNKRTRLRTAFNNDEEFAAFEEAMRHEEQMALTSSRAISGSRTASMLSDATDAGDAAGALLDPVGTIGRMVQQAMKEGAPSDEVAAELYRLLLLPENQEEALKLMSKGSPAVRRNVARVPAILSNVLAQQSPRAIVEDRSP